MPPKIRRPAAVAAVAKAAAGGVRRLRRPSAAEEKVGGVIASADVTLAQCRDMKDIEVVDGSYWTGVCKAALRIKEARVKDGQLYLMAQVLGTQNEDLLRAASGRRGQAIEAHLCDKECAGTPHAEGLLHVKQLRHLGAHREDWMGNLVPADRRGEAEDDLVELRRDRDALMGGDRREGRGEAERASPPRRGRRRRSEEGQEEEQEQAPEKGKVEDRSNQGPEEPAGKYRGRSRTRHPEEVSEESFEDCEEENKRVSGGVQQLLFQQYNHQVRRQDVVRVDQSGTDDWEAASGHSVVRGLRRGVGGASDARGGDMGHHLGSPTPLVHSLLQTTTSAQDVTCYVQRSTDPSPSPGLWGCGVVLRR